MYQQSVWTNQTDTCWVPCDRLTAHQKGINHAPTVCHIVLLTMNVRAASLISPLGSPVSRTNTHSDLPTVSYIDLS